MHEHSSRRGRRMSVGTGTVALSLGLCLCAGQLVAASPAAASSLTAAAPVTAASAAAKVTPKISANFNTRSLKYGSRLRVAVRVIDPRTGKVAKGTVRLQGYSNGAWRTLASTSVKRSVVSLKTKPTRTLWTRTLFTGSGYNQVVSKKIKVTVRVSAGARVLAEAKKHTGALYLFGAAGPKRFDCSGYTMYVYKKAVGKKLPHKAHLQQRYGKSVSKSNKQIGDLIVFRQGSYGSHAGIYAGNGYIYDSPHSGARVGKHKIWSSNYVVRRLAA